MPRMAKRSLDDAALSELTSFLSIPSISTDPHFADDVRAAAEWIAEFARKSGARAELVSRAGPPIVDAFFPAATGVESPSTVVCYGHFDVQPVAPVEAWDTDPFAATRRDGWLYARGVADDKGQLWALLRAAADLLADNALPVNVRFCCDGEEESGGNAIVDYIDAIDEVPAACVIFDTPMLDDETHVFTTATRGTLSMHLAVRTGSRDLHSGIYGGAALNALHVLLRAINRLFESEAVLTKALHAGTIAATESERAVWAKLPSGEILLAAQGAAAADGRAGPEFYERTWERPSLDVNGIEGGSAVDQKTIVVSEAQANLSMRLALGQTAEMLFPIVERELRHDQPESAQLELTLLAACDPGRVPIDAPAVQLAADAFERVLGRRPLMLRSGGSLPIMPLLERRTIPAVVTGFAGPGSNMRAPNERMRESDLADAVAAARETFSSFASLD